jgi:DNA-binding NtrC family response regulator
VARRILRIWLENAGYRTVEFEGGEHALSDTTEGFAALCLDLGLNDVPGLTVLKHLRARDPFLPVIVVTGQRDVDTAVTAMRAGAYDFVVKPVDRERLEHALRRAVERRELAASVQHLRSALDERHALVGQSPPMREVARQIERVGKSDVAVCVFGESGTGKEIVARAIHDAGARRGAGFIAINCAAIPETLHESELFGHEKGAFTGAVGLHRGRFEQAHGGTLFLDEVGEMSASTQASLLRTLQERTIRRVGGITEVPVDVRVIGATHRNLEAEVSAGRFREDLYFRLVVYPIHLPPLRARRDDIPRLVAHFLRKLSSEMGREMPRLSAEAVEALMLYRWPGNVRELQNVVHRAVLSCDDSEITLAHLPRNLRSLSLPELLTPPRPPANEERILSMRELERRAIAQALEASGGSVTKAAKLLGMGRATLYRKLQENPPAQVALATDSPPGVRPAEVAPASRSFATSF